jgi:hypothetical protein
MPYFRIGLTRAELNTVYKRLCLEMHPDKDRTAGATERFQALQQEKAMYDARLTAQASAWYGTHCADLNRAQRERVAKERADRAAAEAARAAKERADRAAAEAAHIDKERAARVTAEAARQRATYVGRASHSGRCASYALRRAALQLRTPRIRDKNMTQWMKHEAGLRTACLEEARAAGAACIAKEHADQVGTTEAVRIAKDRADQAAHAAEAARIAKERADQARARVSAHMAKEWTDQARARVSAHMANEWTDQAHTTEAAPIKKESVDHTTAEGAHIAKERSDGCFTIDTMFEIAKNASKYMECLLVCFVCVMIAIVLYGKD